MGGGGLAQIIPRAQLLKKWRRIDSDSLWLHSDPAGQKSGSKLALQGFFCADKGLSMAGLELLPSSSFCSPYLPSRIVSWTSTENNSVQGYTTMQPPWLLGKAGSGQSLTVWS